MDEKSPAVPGVTASAVAHATTGPPNVAEPEPGHSLALRFDDVAYLSEKQHATARSLTGKSYPLSSLRSRTSNGNSRNLTFLNLPPSTFVVVDRVPQQLSGGRSAAPLQRYSLAIEIRVSELESWGRRKKEQCKRSG
jgi:hypothetical protein